MSVSMKSIKFQLKNEERVLLFVDKKRSRF